MVFRHFKLREQPFGVTPDPRYLYASATHQEALSSILYGIEAGLGFITLTGLPGTGKTTVLFEAMRRLGDNARIAFLFQTILTPADLFRALLIELGVKDVQGSIPKMQAQLNKILVAQSAIGKRLVVVIDEAQNLNHSVLEAVRMLSNFETASHKLIQIILTGQLQLAERLTLPDLLQLRQRISIFGHLKPLSVIEVRAYVQHRLHIAGYDSDESLFKGSALALIARVSEGIPRNINNICFNALSMGYALERKRIDSDIIKAVVADLGINRLDEPVTAPEVVVTERTVIEAEAPSGQGRQWRFRTLSAAAAACALLVSLGWFALQSHKAALANGPAKIGVTVTPATRPLGPQTKSIVALKGQSLFGICAENFGECRPEMLREIIRINPSIHDPDLIKPGQSISIPIPVPVSVSTSVNGNLALNAPTAPYAQGDKRQ
jgi:general secretion pathway protein A